MTPFGQLLKKYLTEHSYSQRYIAGRIGVDPSYISFVISGKKSPPSLSLIQAIARELMLSENQFDELLRAASVSNRIVRIPLKAKAYEYTLIHDFANKLGTLESSKLTELRSILANN